MHTLYVHHLSIRFVCFVPIFHVKYLSSAQEKKKKYKRNAQQHYEALVKKKRKCIELENGQGIDGEQSELTS